MFADWQRIALAIGLTLAGMVLAAWALFADRSRGRRRCPKCWYDLSRTAGLRCSECGFEASNERRLFRTRRRWKWVILAGFVLLVAGFVAIQPKVRRDGWASVTPATVLVLALRLDDPMWALQGLDQRTKVDAPASGYYINTGMKVTNIRLLAEWQWRMIARTCRGIVSDVHSPARRKLAVEMMMNARTGVKDAPTLDLIYNTFWECAADGDPSIQLFSIYNLGSDPNVARAMARFTELLQNETPLTRRNAVIGLRLMLRHSELPIPLLLKSLEDSNAEVRLHAVSALASGLSPREPPVGVFDATLRMIDDPDGSVRQRAVHNLMNFRSERARVEALIAELVQSKDEARHAGALDALIEFDVRPNYAAAAALNGLGDPSPKVRESARDVFLYLTPDELRPFMDRLAVLSQYEDQTVANVVKSKLRELSATD